MEVTDDAVRMLLEVIRRIETQTEKHLRKTLLQDIKRVAGKRQILFRVAEAVIEVPDGTIRTVLFPRVKEETFRELVAESKANGPQYGVWYHYVMRQKFARHYRRMLPLVLDHFNFRSANRFQPVIDALAVLRRYQGTRHQYLPEAVPVEGVVPPSWHDTVLEVHPDGTVRTNRQYYELCVLQQIERALKCKKEVRSREALRPLLLLDLFAEGTNTGIKRVAIANQRYSFNELLYVRQHYFSLEALRHANAAVVNMVLARRNPQLWGDGQACASDGKRFESWRQNLMTEWRSRYKGYGLLVYWHVETNAVCLYSQLRSFSCSEVAAMIEGLIRHDTEMRVERNFVDSHGQSEVAFAFCHLLGGVRLMPRLKRIKYERLYLPDPDMASAFPHLAGVLSRPIRWDLIAQQHDAMIKHAVALNTGTATPLTMSRGSGPGSGGAGLSITSARSRIGWRRRRARSRRKTPTTGIWSCGCWLAWSCSSPLADSSRCA
jgi:hypothetical protein